MFVVGVVLGLVIGVTVGVFLVYWYVVWEEPYAPLPPFPAKGFGNDPAPVSALYRDITVGNNRIFKRGSKFENQYPYSTGRSLWIEVERYESEPPMDGALMDEIENLLD